MQITSKSTIKYPFPADWLPKGERMREWILPYWKLNRTAVNPDTDKFIEGIANDYPEAKVHELQSGSQCDGNWVIPENWAVKKGQLRRTNGEVLVDYDDNPLHLWAHSTAFSGKISREDLIDNHLVSDPNRPDEFLYAYPNAFCYQGRGWGFSLPYRLVESMTDKEYEVEIDTELNTDNSIKVVDLFLPGESEKTILFMAHTCHPAQVNDGIACIAVLIELYKLLQSQENRKYSYRFLFGPEFFGSAAYLKVAPKQDIDSLHSGVFLDMAGTHEPLGMMTSYNPEELINKAFKQVLSSHTSNPVFKGYRELWGNDEIFFDEPSRNIPMIGLGRVMNREYHYNTDDLEHLNSYHLCQTLWVLYRFFELWESDLPPKLLYKPPLYLSASGMSTTLSELQISSSTFANFEHCCCEGLSLLQIAEKINIDFFSLLKLAKKMQSLKLLESV